MSDFFSPVPRKHDVTYLDVQVFKNPEGRKGLAQDVFMAHYSCHKISREAFKKENQHKLRYDLSEGAALYAKVRKITGDEEQVKSLKAAAKYWRDRGVKMMYGIRLQTTIVPSINNPNRKFFKRNLDNTSTVMVLFFPDGTIKANFGLYTDEIQIDIPRKTKVLSEGESYAHKYIDVKDFAVQRAAKKLNAKSTKHQAKINRTGVKEWLENENGWVSALLEMEQVEVPVKQLAPKAKKVRTESKIAWPATKDVVIQSNNPVEIETADVERTVERVALPGFPPISAGNTEINHRAIEAKRKMEELYRKRREESEVTLQKPADPPKRQLSADEVLALIKQKTPHKYVSEGH